MSGTVVPPRHRHRVRVALGVMLALFTLALLIACASVDWLFEWNAGPVRLVIDGTEYGSIDPRSLTESSKVLIGLGVGLAALMLLVVLPLALLVGLAGLLIALVIGLGVPLLLLFVVVAIALSPLWLLVLFGMWLWRRSASSPAAHAAKMAG
jgi:hypothetical protein